MKTLKINQIKPNETNPRYIRDAKFKKLVKSIRDFPEMLEARPLVINPDNVVLGGNMRLRACKEAGLKEVPVYVATWEEVKQREFIIKDNVGYGEWDWDMLANEWDNIEIEDWGLDVWTPEEDVDYSVLDDIDLDDEMGEKEQGVMRAIQIEFDPEHYDKAAQLISEARGKGVNVGEVVLRAFETLS